MSEHKERERPVKALPTDSTTIKSDSILADAADNLSYAEHFSARVIQDALTEALRSTWLRRAEAFESAIHQPSDFAGLCSIDQIEANNKRLAEKAQACRNHASICLFQDSGAICAHLREDI